MIRGYHQVPDGEGVYTSIPLSSSNDHSELKYADHEIRSYQLHPQQIELRSPTFQDDESICRKGSKYHESPSHTMLTKKNPTILVYSVPVVVVIALYALVCIAWNFAPDEANLSQDQITVFQTTLGSKIDRLKQLMTKDLISRGFTRAKLSRQNFKKLQSKMKTKRLTTTADFVQNRAKGMIAVDPSKKYQTIIGFGGAFTDAATYNIAQFSDDDQKSIIDMYFGSEGIGYTLGRVPINSCDFSLKSYNFDNVPDDFTLEHFDNNVTHDTEHMIPVMLAAQEAVSSSDNHLVGLRLLASPWSPPAWMKVPINGAQSMVGSSLPNGLIASHDVMQSWALYISKWIAAYKRYGLNIWALTPQNEPAFAAPWEACVYNASFEKYWVENYLGPTLDSNGQEDVKILGLDHNKNIMLGWTQTLIEKSGIGHFDGIAFHWYGDNMNRLMDGTYGYNNVLLSHDINPNMILLGSEACSCPGVASDESEKWLRAERAAHDIIYDLIAYAQGWIDWNIVVNSVGGPNHVGNNCDAPITASDSEYSSFTIQPKFYYLGQISKFFTPGSKRIASAIVGDYNYQLINPHVESGLEAGVYPCESSSRQIWYINQYGNIVLYANNFDTLNDDGTNEWPEPHYDEMCLTIPVAHGAFGTGRIFVAIGRCSEGWLIVPGGQGWQSNLIVVDKSYKNPGMIRDTYTGMCLTMDPNKESSSYMGASGSLLKLEPCDEANSLQQFVFDDITIHASDKLYKNDAKPFEMIPSNYIAQGDGELISSSLCITAGWPFLYGVAVHNENDNRIALVIMNEADVDVDLQYTDDGGKTMITYGINGKSISTINVNI